MIGTRDMESKDIRDLKPEELSELMEDLSGLKQVFSDSKKLVNIVDPKRASKRKAQRLARKKTRRHKK